MQGFGKKNYFKITGYIQSIYKDGWDTILTRYALNIPSIRSREKNEALTRE